MDQHEIAEARHNTYRLLAALFDEGLTPSALPYVQALPELQPHVPERFDADQAGADHHQLFGMTLLPYESVFLTVEGLLGGPRSEALLRVYGRLGYRPVHHSASPDHLSTQLGLLAFLAGAEADAWADGERETAIQLRDEQRGFLEQHLLRWLPPFAAALQEADAGFYGATGELTLAFTADHLEDLGVEETEFALPEPAAILDDPETSLRDIAGYLLTPLHSGVFLTLRDIQQIGRRARLPRGFGNREQTLVNLMRTAAQYDDWETLLAALDDLLSRWESRYARLVAAWPALAPFVHPWRRRRARSAQLLAALAV